MKIVFCAPNLTMDNTKDAEVFMAVCKNVLDTYDTGTEYILNKFLLIQKLAQPIDESDILVYFNAENGKYRDNMICLFEKFSDAGNRIWPIAMESSASCRKPPDPIANCQSFDVSCRNENRNPLKNNIKAIAGVFARKLVSQVLSPMYRDEVLYFISHRRSDGEHIAAKLADELKCLTRERNIFRDVVNVEVGSDAQAEIDENLEISDIVIFLHTKDSAESDYIMKELCYAMSNGIPVLWIQIDDAPISELLIHPGENPALCYKSTDFDNSERLIDIAEEVEECCFSMIMQSSSENMATYMEYLLDLQKKKKIEVKGYEHNALTYQVKYQEINTNIYDNGERNDYIQCFGRNLSQKDIEWFVNSIADKKILNSCDRVFMLANHGNKKSLDSNEKIIIDKYDNYIMNLESLCGVIQPRNNKRIILSGAFPDCDEIYKASLLEALYVYSREIIRNGYILVFGAHPTFQEIIFDIGRRYTADPRSTIEMHMDEVYLSEYNKEELEESCNLILSNGLHEMRERMISESPAEVLICLGGKIKEDSAEQGVDEEVRIAQQAGIPVALVGTVGGRSSEYAYEIMKKGAWDSLNSWGTDFNENLFYNVNHRMMIRQLLDILEAGENEII